MLAGGQAMIILTGGAGFIRSNILGALNAKRGTDGLSKLAFDNHVRIVAAQSESTVAGLRYFNVYGPRESHKGKMASMVYQLYRDLKASGRARLFKGTDGYADGEQLRDFIFVDDIVRVNLALAEGPVRSGIFNVGAG